MNIGYYLLFLVVSVIAGYIIAWLSRDELVSGRKWFQILIIASFVFALTFLMFGYYSEMMVFLFILVVSWISYVKSKDKKWIKKN